MTERRFHSSFRLRVLGSFVALVAGITFAGLAFQRAVLHERLERDVDGSLDQERAELDLLAKGLNPANGQPFGADVTAIFDTFLERNLPLKGEVYVTFVARVPYASTPAPQRLELDPEFRDRWSTLSEGTWGSGSTAAGPVRYLAVPLAFEGEQRGVFVIVNFLRAAQEEIETTVRITALIAIGTLTLGSIVAWFVAGRLLRPVRELTAAAEAISDSDLDRRVPASGRDEIARLAHRFNEMLDRLGRSIETQRAFIDDAGHELRTPITIVRGQLELMGDDPADQREALTIVDDELRRMTRMVDDLLLLAKAEQPDFIDRRAVDIGDLTADLLAKARTLGPRRWTLDAMAAGIVVADRQRLSQAVFNLARNAVDHTHEGAEIALGSAWAQQGLNLWVRDTGSGIDPTEIDRIFDRFGRGRGRTHRADGAGLGLAITRSIVEAHGGRIEVESVLGSGSTFTMTIPGEPDVTRPSELDERTATEASMS